MHLEAVGIIIPWINLLVVWNNRRWVLVRGWIQRKCEHWEAAVYFKIFIRILWLLDVHSINLPHLTHPSWQEPGESFFCIKSYNSSPSSATEKPGSADASHPQSPQRKRKNKWLRSNPPSKLVGAHLVGPFFIM